MEGQPVKEFDKAYLSIRELILSMKINPGDAITELSLAEQLAIGRTPVREALKRLEHDGLITTQNGRKTVYTLSAKEVSDIFDLKICLESATAAWAAERGSDAHRTALRAVLDQMRTLAQEPPADVWQDTDSPFLQAWLAADRQLHHLLFQMAGNGRTEDIVQKLNLQWHRLRVGIYTIEGRVERGFAEHETFVQAVLERGPEAAHAAMSSHLSNLKNELLRLMKVFHYPGA